jgi:hypothetical protein
MLPVFFFSILHILAVKRENDRLARGKVKKSLVKFKTINLSSGEEVENKHVLSQKTTKKRKKKKKGRR